ncbi:Rhodanese-like domain-containing protein [Giardia muris]|uniref:Rhodanese-like domain-containing protein n=1 Tax=Giardia muris TaxID=5742 RepID=A0A4Z1SRW6_GIAMU|nr:Rhodanese-like domain-containing protein [Giardia muris]|eukprot:TNJ28652.1 Rhodanese-like domain-containing protein [Giardia muris]
MSACPFKTIRPVELPSLLGGAAVALDVRDNDYDEGGHFRDSINIPIKVILDSTAETLTSLQRYQTIACYCMFSMQRGPAAATHLATIFPKKTIYVVEGGYNAILETFHGTERIVPPKEE